MIRNLLLILVMTVTAFSSQAAPSGGFPNPEGKSKEQMFKEIQEFKLKYLAQEIELKEDQREPFFQLYDEMTQKRWKVMNAARKAEKAVKQNKDATEADYQAASNAMTKARAEDAAIEKEYDAKFAKFLTQKQIYKLKQAEDSFRKKMDEMRHKHKKPKHEKK